MPTIRNPNIDNNGLKVPAGGKVPIGYLQQQHGGKLPANSLAQINTGEMRHEEWVAMHQNIHQGRLEFARRAESVRNSPMVKNI